MSDDDRLTTDEIKGRVKKAAGDLTDNDELREEGEVDETAGKAKGFIDDVKDKVTDKIDEVADRIKN